MDKNTTQRRKRILALDILRGAFLVAIIADHLNWGPSLFHIITGGGKLFSSPAEGFFTISGLMVGYVYGPRIVRSFRAAASKLWKRAFLLYGLSVVFTVCYTAIAVSVTSTALPPVWAQDGNSFLLNTLLARYSYGWTDFLPRYAVFMALAPFILWLIVRGKTWIVIALSAVTWALFHTTPALLPFSAWEIIFIPSIVVGYYLPQLESAFMSLTPRIRRLVRRTVWSGAALTFLASSVTQVIFPALSIATIDTSGIAGGFDKETLGVGRLLLGVLWFWALYGFIRIHERRIDQLTRGMLVTLGTKLLYVYGIHGCVIFILTLTLTPPSQPPILMSTLFAASVIGLIYVIAVSPTIARYLDYQYHAYRVQTLLGYNRSYESS